MQPLSGGVRAVADGKIGFEKSCIAGRAPAPWHAGASQGRRDSGGTTAGLFHGFRVIAAATMRSCVVVLAENVHE